MKLFAVFALFLSFFLSACGNAPLAQSAKLENEILSTDGLVAFWNFKEEANFARKSFDGKFPLSAHGGEIGRADEGPFSGHSAVFDGRAYLSLPHGQSGALNISTNAVTVIAWVKLEHRKNSFIAGMWNEYEDGGRRQYGLFVSLPYYNGKDQVCGHISKSGKPTPPFPYSIDYSASPQIVPLKEWVCAAFSYDGKYIKSYFNGDFEARAPEAIKHTKCAQYPEGLTHSKNPYYYPDGMGINGSDFTVGAVLLKSGMGNIFKGQIGGIAVFNRALSDTEIKSISRIPTR